MRSSFRRAMTIPIRNLYYMFLYAWARFPGGAVGSVGSTKPGSPKPLGKLLADGTRDSSPRAGSRISNVHRRAGWPPRPASSGPHDQGGNAAARTAVCDFDELTHDVLHNQVLKATLVNLSCCPDLQARPRHDLTAQRSDWATFHRTSGSRRAVSAGRGLAEQSRVHLPYATL